MKMGKKKKGSKKGSKKASSKGNSGVKTIVRTGEEKLWVKRLAISEESRSQHRNNASSLVAQNTKLQSDLQSAERDAIEVIAHFNQQLAKKEQENGELVKQLKSIKRLQQEEIAELQKIADDKVLTLKDRCESAERLLAQVQADVESLREWKDKRQQMRDELEALKADNELAKKQYEEFLEKKEEKFMEERIRLRKETEAEIERLASSAHSTAVAGLDATTRKTYTENVRLSEELAITNAENERLVNVNEGALRRNIEMECELAEAKQLATQSVVKMKKQEKAMKALKEKVVQLESTLGLCVREFEHEREMIVAQVDEATDSTRADLDAAHRALALKAAENKRIRHLAKYIVEQRSEMEIFFHEALDSVRSEISRSRKLYELSVKEQYKRDMLEGNRNGMLPPIKTSDSIKADYEAAAKMPDNLDQVDIRDLTWEQKETVLRRLFAKMNEAKKLASMSGSAVSQPLRTNPKSMPSIRSSSSFASISAPHHSVSADDSADDGKSFFLTNYDDQDLST